MRARYLAIFVASLFFCLVFFATSVNSAENKKAREVGELELSKYVKKCGDIWYVKPLMSIWELRNKGKSNLTEEKLYELDKQNGFEFKGDLTWRSEGPSRRYRWQWGQWEEYPHVIVIIIEKKNGTLSAKQNDEGLGYSEFNCDEVPGRVPEPNEAKPSSAVEELKKR